VLIIATELHNTDTAPATALKVAVDLRSLDQGERRFAEYETQIREEHRSVPKPIFNFKRAEILKHFLARNRISATDSFATNYGLQARCKP
jgi:predicted metal-dependent HD superfamily phosphohydrolase